jgi:hypothetical protein
MHVLPIMRIVEDSALRICLGGSGFEARERSWRTKIHHDIASRYARFAG